jgi:hypothetical protein
MSHSALCNAAYSKNSGRVHDIGGVNRSALLSPGLERSHLYKKCRALGIDLRALTVPTERRQHSGGFLDLEIDTQSRGGEQRY